MRPYRSDLAKLYGTIAHGKWANEGQHMTTFPLMPEMVKALKHGHLYCNHDMVIPLKQAFRKIIDRGLIGQIHSFDGIFNIRQSRSDTRQSVHSYGLAIDLNAATNGLGTKGHMTKEFVACFKEEGFIWGGDWHRPDPMHFQYCEEK